MSESTATADVPVIPDPPVAPHIPSMHVRAFVTWLAIFPLVTIGMTALTPVSIEWHPVLRTFVLTAVVVPLAFYVVVPRLMQAYGALRRRTVSRTR